MSGRNKRNSDLSSYKRARDRLNQNTEKYRLLVENVDIPMVYYALDGRFLFVNTFAARNLGGIPEDFIGKSLYDIVPHIAEEIRERNNTMADLGVAQRYEDLIRLPAGNRWYFSIAQPLCDEHGKVYAIQVISFDITQFKRQEIALQSLAREFAQAAVESIASRDLDKYNSLTPREKEVFQLTAMGYDRSAVAKRLFISPRTAEAHRANLMRKLGIRSKFELIRYALQNGLVPLEE